MFVDLNWGTFVLLLYREHQCSRWPDVSSLASREEFFHCVSHCRFLFLGVQGFDEYGKDHSPSPQPSCGHCLLALSHFLVRGRPGHAFASWFFCFCTKSPIGAGAVMCSAEVIVCMIYNLCSLNDENRCILALPVCCRLPLRISRF